MAEKNKSIIESALLDAKRIQEALNANTKEILRSVAIEEIDGLVKESLEEGYDEEDAEEETDDVDVTNDDADDSVDSEETETDSEFTTDDSEEDDLEGGEDMSMSAEPLGGDEEVRDMTQASDDDVIRVYKELTGDSEIEVVVDDVTGEIKLSINEPGEFIIKTGAGKGSPEVGADEFGAEGGEFGAEAGIEGGEFGAEFGAEGGTEGGEFGADEFGIEAGAEGGEFGSEEGSEFGAEEDEEEEVMYEIALDEMEDIDGQKAPLGKASKDNWAGDNLKGGFDDDAVKYAKAEGDMVMSEGEDDMEDDSEETIDETKYVGGKVAKVATAHTNAKLQNESKKPKMTINEVANKYNTLLAEARDLRGRNEEYKEALKKFRTMLAETVVFNSNLTYVTKLFMEHSTTKDEKQVILKRFDEEVSTLKESKRLYKTIVNELSSRKPMNESIDRKFNKDVSSGVSKQLNESTAYIDKETQRIKDLMNRVEKR
jgi:hypothetical protein